MNKNEGRLPEERLAKKRRAISRTQLVQEIRALGGYVPETKGDDVSEIELMFFRRVIAFEKGPISTHREWLARQGFVFLPPKELAGRELERELWRLIEALGAARVFLHHTNHLSDTELYGKLWDEVLAGNAPDFARTPDDGCHWDFADASVQGEHDWLAFHATERERQEWKEAFPDVDLPTRRSPPFQRDHRLPVRD